MDTGEAAAKHMKTIQFNKGTETMKRNQRRSAAWGGKLLVLGTMILTASLALAQSKISPDLQTAVNFSSAASKLSLIHI